MISRLFKKKPSQPTWSDLPQMTSPRSRSEWLRRFLRTAFKVSAFLLICVGVVIGGWYGFKALNKKVLSADSSETSGYRSVYFETDGTLDQAWLQKTLPELQTEKGSPPLSEILQRIQSEGQVLHATVEHISAEALRVQVKERTPLIRIGLIKGNKSVVYCVSREGYVYEGINYLPVMTEGLPFLKGLTLKRNGQGYQPISDIDRICRVLDESRLRAPEVYDLLRIVDCSKGINTPLSFATLLFELRNGRQILLPVEGFSKALQRLRTLHLAVETGELPPFVFADLTLEYPVLSNTPRKPF